MVSVFPSLLTYSEISPLLIRLTLAAVIIFWALRQFRSNNSNEKIVSIIEGIAGLLLIIGLWTQVAALVIAIDLVIKLIGKIRTRTLLTDGVNYYLILLVLALSILVTGPGFFSFDMPL